MAQFVIIMLIAFLLSLGFSFLRNRLEKYQFPKWKLVVMTVLIPVFGYLGARFLFMLESGNFDVTQNGRSFFGAMFLVPAGMAVSCLLLKIPAAKGIDFSAVYVPLYLACLRVGCHLDGCCGSNPIQVGDELYFPPIQLIECGMDLFLMLVLFHLERKSEIHTEGEQYCKLMVGYGVIRLLMENYRCTPKSLYGMSNGQWLSFLCIGLGFALLYWMRKSHTR